MMNLPAALLRVMPLFRTREQPRDRRIAQRTITVAWAGMLRVGGVVRSACIRNISASGLMAEVDVILRPGTRAEMIVHGYGAITGTVRWYNRGSIGLSFDAPIMLDRILLARSGAMPVA